MPVTCAVANYFSQKKIQTFPPPFSTCDTTGISRKPRPAEPCKPNTHRKSRTACKLGLRPNRKSSQQIHTVCVYTGYQEEAVPLITPFEQLDCGKFIWFRLVAVLYRRKAKICRVVATLTRTGTRTRTRTRTQTQTRIRTGTRARTRTRTRTL